MVKSFAFVATASFALVHAAQPGQCINDKDCASYGSGYTCVSVQTTIANIAMASQCVLGTPCGGNNAGKCPTFSSWSTSYQKIQPLCAFVPVTAANCVDPTQSNASTTNAVNCYVGSFSANNVTKTVNGIYKCVDVKMYQAQNLGAIQNLTATQLQACAGDASTGGALCNNHGTCAPTGSLSPVYRCACNSGYSASDNCFNATSNACDNFGSCGAGNTCDATTASCKCAIGTRGDQCALCDATASNACTNGNGVCNLNGTCTCNPGYVGSLCQTATTPSSGSNAGTPKPNGVGVEVIASLAAWFSYAVVLAL
ncbi:Aste57867_23959 [Aphanomyces stellatus]|uniref:Aste57867_23959 protein n=1 Tax=Aphanomyces stellatus TaxID=120398 RepID=A0A485LTI0_9STRA|nr:hypothetical protein As57867_023886 [Aphanomyces stellatus]VFU00602.1 Aste57867_23959 [Aphanomyces stellatus]